MLDSEHISAVNAVIFAVVEQCTRTWIILVRVMVFIALLTL